jgi:hypothetical protein
VALGVDGALYPKHPVVMPLLAQPFYWLLGYDGLLVFNVLAVLVAAWLCLALLDPACTRPGVAVAVTLTCLSPVVTHFVYGYSNDLFAAAPVVGGAWALRRERAGLAGIAFALAIWARPVHALPAALVVAPWAWNRARDRAWAQLVRLAAGLAGVLAVPALLQWSWFGSPFVTGYDRILVRERGVQALDSARSAFAWPGWADLRRVALDGDLAFVRGLPVVALVPLGWIAQVAVGRRGEALTSALALGGAAFVFAAYAYPGSRFLVPWLPFVAAPLAALFEVAVQGARAGRERLARTLPLAARAVVWTMAALLGLAAAGYGLRGLAERPDASAIATARVAIRGERACDFWNLKWQRWECSHLDRDESDMVGAPRSGECALPGRGWVRVPTTGPFEGKVLEVEGPAGASALEWEVSPDPSARPASSVAFVISGLRVAVRLDVSPQAAVVRRRDDVAVGGEPVRFDVAADSTDGRRAALCLRWEWK